MDLTLRRRRCSLWIFRVETSLNFTDQGLVLPLNPGWKMSAKGRGRALHNPTDFTVVSMLWSGPGQRGGRPIAFASPTTTTHRTSVPPITACSVPGTGLLLRRW